MNECCVCYSCNHTGEHFYCLKHQQPKVQALPKSDTHTAFVSYGWVCPLCGVSYAPHIPQCENHQLKIQTSAGTTLEIKWPPA